MKKRFLTGLLLVLAFSVTACVQDKIDGALNDCKAFVEEILPQVEDDIWEKCSVYYDDEVIPRIREEMESLIDEMQEWFNARLDEVTDETMIDFGCYKDITEESGWDCSNSWLCE